MTELGQIVEINNQGDLLPKPEFVAKFVEGTHNVLLPTLAPENGSPSKVDFFSPRWLNETKLPDTDERTALVERRQHVLDLVQAERQEQNKQSFADEQGQQRESKVTFQKNPDGSLTIKYGLVKKRPDGTQYFQEGEASVGDLVFAYSVIAEQSKNPEIQKQAAEMLNFLRQHTQVTYGGKKESGKDFYNKELSPEVADTNLNFDEGMVRLSAKEKELQPQYKLICREEEKQTDSSETVAGPSKETQEAGPEITSDQIPELMATYLGISKEQLEGLIDRWKNKKASQEKLLAEAKKLAEETEEDKKPTREQKLEAAKKIISFLTGEPENKISLGDTIDKAPAAIKQALKMYGIEGTNIDKSKLQTLKDKLGENWLKYLLAIMFGIGESSEALLKSASEGN